MTDAAKYVMDAAALRWATVGSDERTFRRLHHLADQAEAAEEQP